MKFIFTLLLLGSFTFSNAQELTDLQKTDITRLSSFDGEKFQFYGFHLNMSKQEALDQLRTLKELTWEFDNFNTKSEDPNSMEEMRIYVNKIDDTQGEKKLELFALIWDKGSLNLKSIVFFNDAQPLFAGNTQKLFTPEAAAPKTKLLKFLSSSPVVKEGITNTYTYVPEHFSLITMDGGKTVRFKLVE